MEVKLKVNQPVWHIKINNPIKEGDYIFNKRGIVIEELKIIGISDYKICLNNDYFTCIDFCKDGEKKDRSYKKYINDVDVSIRTEKSVLGGGVFISLFSTLKPTKQTLKKMVSKASVKIDKEYGFLFNEAKEELYGLVDNYKQ